MRKKMISPIFALFPKRCVFCGRLISASRDYCDSCEGKIRRVEEPSCPKCGRGKEFCRCGSRRRFYSSLVAPFYFEGVVRRGIHHFKFSNALHSADYFAASMVNTVKSKYADAVFDEVLCVPMTQKAGKRRGYNQSALLSQKVAQAIGVKYREDLLIKIYETDCQHGLNFFMRKGNLTGVFDVSQPAEVEGKRILLIDDIATSGETLDECAKMLYLYGAAEIRALTLALTKAGK